MRIIFIDVYNPLPINSGGDWYRYQLLNEMGKENEVIEYYTHKVENKIGYSSETIMFQTEYLHPIINWNKYSKILEIIRPEYFFSIGFGKKKNADVLFVNAYSYHIGNHMKPNKKVPIVLVMQNVEWQYLKDNGSNLFHLMRIYEHHIIKNVDGIIAISPKDYDYVKKNFPQKKVFFIPPKVDSALFNTDGKIFEYDDEKFNLLFYGSLDRNQNIEALNFILNSLIPALKNSGLMLRIKMNIFGSGRPPSDLMLEKNSDINFLGQVKNPGEYVRGADVILVPLKNSGGMKIRILEALACGKIVIATSEAKEGLPDDLAKYVYTADSTDEFVTTIGMLLERKCENKVDREIVQINISGESIRDVLRYYNL